MIVTTDRGRFHVERTGDDGPAVLMLHPLALAGAAWDPVAAHLGAGRRVVAPDARGHGDSEWDGGDFTVTDLAADAAAIIEELDLAPAHVVGLSMGGSTALVLAATRPELVDRLVLADTTACYGPDRLEKWAERARNAAGVPRERQLEFQVDRWFAEEFRDRRPDEVARIAKIFLATDSRAHAAACRALGVLDATALLPRIQAPALVLAGEEDYATPPAMAHTIAEGVAGARLRTLPATRHLSLIERPDLWPSVAAFLDGDPA
jgi:3-oxoadipate enol-lactonase